MNYGEIQARATLLASFEGYADVNPAPDWPTLVNRAWRMFSYDAELILKTDSSTSTVSGTMEYTISGTWKDFLEVTYNGVGLIRSSEAFERNLSPSWRLQTPGTPKRFVVSQFGTLAIVPPPNAIQTLTARGVIQGPDMVLTTDQPNQVSGTGNPIPEIYHEGIAVRAAWLHGIVYATGEARARLEIFEQRYQEYVMKARAGLNTPYRRTDNGEGG